MTENNKNKRSRGRPSNAEEDQEVVAYLQQIAAKNELDKSLSTPLWMQLRNLLEEASDHLEAQTRLPSQDTLCAIFQVSRPVVRSAISALAAEGKLIKLSRKGVFVARPSQETDFLTTNLSVFTDLAAHGYEVSEKTLKFYRASPDKKEQEVFGLSESDTVVRILRVYYLDGCALTYTNISLPGHRVQDIENIPIEGESIFSVLKSRYGLVSKRAERWFTVAIPEEEALKAMDLEGRQPMIWIESIAYDSDSLPIEYYRAYYNSTVARIHVTTGDS